MRVSLTILVVVLGPFSLQAAAPHPTVLAVEYKEKVLPVEKMKGSDPVVLVDGKEVRIRDETIYLPQRTSAFSPEKVQVLRASLAGTQFRFVANEADSANNTPRTGSDGGLAEFTVTLQAERPLAGGFIVVVLYTPAVFNTVSPLADTQIIARELPPLPAGKESLVSITSKMFTYVPNQRYFVQIFDDRGREVLTNVAQQGWAYYQTVERARLAKMVPGYRARFSQQDQAAVPWVIIKPILPAGATWVGSSRVDLQACKLEYSIVSPK